MGNVLFRSLEEKSVKIAFFSHLDLNLYLFRLPIMKELVKRGHSVYAITPKGEVFDKFKEFGINAIDYNIKRDSLNVFNELNTIREVKKIVKDLDVDILHTFMHKPNIYGNLTKANNIINTITGLGSFFVDENLKAKIVRTVIIFLYKFTTKYAKKIVFQNQDDLNYFVSQNIIPSYKAVLIKSSGVDTTFFKPQKANEKLLKELNIDNKKPVVLMIARVIKDKGVEEYIKAASILKDKATFLYVGGIDKGNKNAFLPNWENVKYLGFRKDIKDLISISDIVVLPSYREGVPRTLLEAASMGKALVTTDSVGCREVVIDNYNGFLVPIKDYVTLSKKIEILISNPLLREKFGKNSRELAIKEFDVKIVVDKYLKLYEEILKKKDKKCK